MMWCYQEPGLEDMLADSIVRAVMDADGVDPRALETALQETAVLWRAAQGASANPYRPYRHCLKPNVGSLKAESSSP